MNAIVIADPDNHFDGEGCSKTFDETQANPAKTNTATNPGQDLRTESNFPEILSRPNKNGATAALKTPSPVTSRDMLFPSPLACKTACPPANA